MALSSQPTAKTSSAGEELSQLAGFLFGQASRLWWWSRTLEVGAGLIVVCSAAIDPGDTVSAWGAIVSTTLVVIAYGMRLVFEDKYDTAETMRRQSVLSEGLGWPVSKWHKTEWERKAGPRLLKRLKSTARDPEYYGTKSPVGAKRLAEMTLESEFYTRHQYIFIGKLAWVFFGIAGGGAVIVVLTTANQAVPQEWGALLARSVFVAIPVVLTADFLGWALRLHRMTREFEGIEKGLDFQVDSDDPQLAEVMRLVSEYNCRVVGGIPLPPWMWPQWHDRIHELWDRRS